VVILSERSEPKDLFSAEATRFAIEESSPSSLPAREEAEQK